MNHGALHVLAIFDKPDPLDGPFFEETIYVDARRRRRRTCSGDRRRRSRGRRAAHRPAPRAGSRRVPRERRRACSCSKSPRGRSAACAPARCASSTDAPDPRATPISLEELLLRHALGRIVARLGARSRRLGRDDDSDPAARRPSRGVAGLDEARARAAVSTTCGSRRRPTSCCVPLPEGASYLGFIFARADDSRPP